MLQNRKLEVNVATRERYYESSIFTHMIFSIIHRYLLFKWGVGVPNGGVSILKAAVHETLISVLTESQI